MREITAGNKCEWSDCASMATHLVYSRNAERVLKCCSAHADIIVDEAGPEYTTICENCGCRVPIN